MTCGLSGYCGPITTGPLRGYTMTPVRVAVPSYMNNHGSIRYATRQDYESSNGLSALEFAATREPVYVQHHGTYHKVPPARAYAGPIKLPEAGYVDPVRVETEKTDRMLHPLEHMAMVEAYNIGQALQAAGDYSRYSQARQQRELWDAMRKGDLQVTSNLPNAVIPVYVDSSEQYSIAVIESSPIEEKRSQLEKDIARLRNEGIKEVLYVN